jgi:hypothetical protein
MLFMALAVVSCKPSKPLSASKAPTVTSNFISEIKSKTGVELPKSCRLILSTNSGRLDSDVWLFEIDGGDKAQFPGKMALQPPGDRSGEAKIVERMSGSSIGIPTSSSFGIWQISNAQCHATLITTTNSEFLMLERLY